MRNKQQHLPKLLLISYALLISGFISKAQNVGIGINNPSSKLDVMQTEAFTPAINAVSTPGFVGVNGNAIRGINLAEYGSGIAAQAPTNGLIADQEGGGFGFLARVGDNKFGLGAYSTNLASIRAVTQSGVALSASGGTGYALSTLGKIQLSGIGEGGGKLLMSDALGNADWQTIQATDYGAWGTSGNTGNNTNSFIGNIDNTDIRFRTNNIERMAILANGNVGIGFHNPTTAKLEVAGSGLPNAVIVRNTSTGDDIVGLDARTNASSGAAVIGNAYSSGSGFAIPLNVSAGVIGYGQGANVGVGGFSYNGNALHAVSYEGNALYTSGKIRMTGIGHAAGKILVSDINGNATWQNPSTLTLDQSSPSGISQFEFRNGGIYRGAFGWSQADGRFFFYDGESATNTLFINNGRMGIRRDATTNALEVGGDASKSTAGSWLGNSDARLKKNIFPVTDALNKLLQLKGVQYEWNDTRTGYPRPSGMQMGFTAQNVQEVFPEKVSADAQGYLQTAYGTYDPLIVEAIRELKNENEQLKKELAEIKKILQKNSN